MLQVDFMSNVKNKVAIVAPGYAWLPCEPGPSRFYDIAMTFVRAGWKTDLIGSSFQHFEKKPRDIRLIRDQHYPFKTTFVDGLPYKKNIDPVRVFGNYVLAANILRYLENHDFDLVYCAIPANNIAASVGRYCRRRHIPLIIDVEDLWPEAMDMVIHSDLAKKFIYPFFSIDAEAAYACADAVVGTSEDYTRRAVQNNRRRIPLRTVYVGCDLAAFDEGVRQFSSQIKKDPGEFWVSYAGSIGKSYDIQNLVRCAGLLEKSGHSDIRFKILGTGPEKEECEQLARKLGCHNVCFEGYVDYPKMAAYLTRSDLVVNSFAQGAPQSIVNKIGDYLASGRPMLNTLGNPVFTSLVSQKDFGINVPAGQPSALACEILKLEKDPAFCARLGANARRTAERQFDRARSYKAITRLADRLARQA